MKRKELLKVLITFGILLFIAVMMFFIYTKLKPQVATGSKHVVVEVIIPDEKNQEFSINTNSEYLGEALKEINLIKGTEGEYGLFITEVNNRTANDNNQEWWCITKNGENVYTGVDITPITDGDHYELTLTIGY